MRAAKALYMGHLVLPADSDRITIIGDSAGGIWQRLYVSKTGTWRVYTEEADTDLSGTEQLLYGRISL